MLLISLWQTVTGVTAMPAPATDPSTWVSTDDYPAAALQAKAEGLVQVSLTIDAAGKVTGCSVVSGSGNVDLDAGTCTTLRARASFEPGADDRVSVRTIRWTLPDTSVTPDGTPLDRPYVPTRPVDIVKARMVDSVAEIEAVIGYDGRVESCRVTQPASTTDTRLCDAFPVGRAMGSGFVRDGVPIKALFRQRMTTSTTFP